jgi:ribosome maturation factor RimP
MITKIVRVGVSPLFVVVYNIEPKGGLITKRAEIEEKVTELVTPLIEENHLELVDVEYVKEGSDYYLRIYADKEGGITIGDCERVNRAMSDIMDENDFIKEAYILEVSSPGLTRPLKKDKDFARSIGKLVEVKTFKKIDDFKEFEGELLAYDDESITIRIDDEDIKILRNNISSIRLAFTF